MDVIDGTGLYHDAIKRIQQLEKLNSDLAAEVDRQRAVVDAAVSAVMKDRPMPLTVIDAVMDYNLAKQKAMAHEASRVGANDA